MPKFTKKPVIVEAYQVTRKMIEDALFHKKPYPKGLTHSSASYNAINGTVNAWHGEVVTIHGQKTEVREKDWIIAEPDGEHFYPCKPDIFDATYQLIMDNGK